METNGLSLKSQEIGSKRKWETAADLSRRFCSNQHESPWEGGTEKHIACHSSGYQGHSSQEWPPCNDGLLTTMLGGQKDFRFCSNQHESPWEGGTTEHIACHSSWYQGNSSQEWSTWNGGSLTTSLGRQNDFRFCSNQHKSPWEGGTTEHIACHTSWYQGHSSQEWPTRNGGSLTPSLGRQKDFHVSGDRFFLTFNPYQQDVESRYLQDKKNGAITCLVCGKEGHYSCNCHFKDQEPKIICTVCSKNGHCSMWRCRQNKSENRACTRCGEIGHSTSTHGLSCSSCDEYHGNGECRLREVKCFICESQDHYLAQCPLNSVLTAAFKGQRENFQAALRLALSKQGSPSSTPAKCSAKSKVKVLTANKSIPICFTCREEGHYARVCRQKFGAISGNTSKEVEESSTIATSSKMSKVLEEQDPGTAKQSSEMKPASVVGCVSCGEEGHRAKSCPTRVFTCYKCNEEGHTAKNCPQKQSSEMKPKSNVHCVRCGEEGHRAKSCPTRVFTCYKCSEEGHTAKDCPQKQSSEMKPKSNVHCVRCGEEGHRAKSCPTRVFKCYKCREEGHRSKDCPYCERCGEEGHGTRKCPLKHQPLTADKSSPQEGGTTEHQDKMNGIITCLVCGKEGHYSCDWPFKDQEHKVICTVCSKNGHWSISCCQQNKSENRACTRCGEIGHSTSTHGLLSCSSCDEYHLHGECRLSKVKCFICESQDHYLAQCPLNSVLNAVFQDQRENFQAAPQLALSKQLNTLSKRTCHLVRPIGRAYNLRTRICLTCREEGHVAFYCPQKRGSILPDLSKQFEESRTIAKSSNLSKELEERDPGTGSAKQSSKMKPASVVRCVSCGQEGHRARSCPTRVFICSLCNEEGHKAKKCPQKRQKR